MADLKEGTVHKGGQNLTYQITERPPDPPGMRPAASDAKLLDAETEARALIDAAGQLETLAQERDAARELCRDAIRARNEVRRDLDAARAALIAVEKALAACRARAERAEEQAATLGDAGTWAQQRAHVLGTLLIEAMDAVRVFHGRAGWETYRDHAPEIDRWRSELRATGLRIPPHLMPGGVE